MKRWAFAAAVLFASPAFAQSHVSTLNYSITVTNNDPQLTFPPGVIGAGGSYVSCTAAPGEHVAHVFYSGVYPNFPMFSTNDATGSFVVVNEFDGIWLEVSAAGIAPALCGVTTTVAVTARGDCATNFVFDGTQQCNFVAAIVR